jgi:transcriptional regulator with XRE-family HTH domain
MPERMTPRAASDHAKEGVGKRLTAARRAAGLNLRVLAASMADAGYSVHFTHLSNIERGRRNPTRALLDAWAVATRQPDAQAWVEELVAILNQGGLGLARQVVPMRFRLPDAEPVMLPLVGKDLLEVVMSADALYARIAELMSRAAYTVDRDWDSAPPVIVTTLGPIRQALAEITQSVVHLKPAGVPLIELMLARTHEDHLTAFQHALAAHATTRGDYEPLLANAEATHDVIAVPGAGGAIVLQHRRGYLWIRIPAEGYRDLHDHLDPQLKKVRSKPYIEFVRPGPQVSQYWFSGWEETLLQHEKFAVQRIMVQRHLGLLTTPRELAASFGDREANLRGIDPQDRQNWNHIREERIRVFQRKLTQWNQQHQVTDQSPDLKRNVDVLGSAYRDIASREAVEQMADDGHIHVRGEKLPPDTDPVERLRRLREARDRLVHLHSLVDEAVGYDLRIIPDSDILADRHWTLVSEIDPESNEQIDVLLTFTLGADPSVDPPQSFVNAAVYDQIVIDSFKDDFDKMWPKGEHQQTLDILAGAISKLTRHIEAAGSA